MAIKTQFLASLYASSQCTVMLVYHSKKATLILSCLFLLTGCGNHFLHSRRIVSRIVLGQTNFTSNANIEKGYYNPYGVTTCVGKLFVTDITSNRVLGYNSIPTTNHSPADFALGQPDLHTVDINTGGISGNSMYAPVNAYCDGTRLFVADTGNHRILIWNSVPSSNRSADLALGQTSLVLNNATIALSTSLWYPSGVYSDGNKVFVADRYNHRVLIWNTIPTASGTAADVVLGQTGMNGGSCNQGGAVSSQTLCTPYDVWGAGGKLFVADVKNNRVLIWTTIPTLSGTAANFVIGQSLMTDSINGTTINKLYSPITGWSDGTLLFISDYTNNRVLKWNTVPTSNGANADLVLGQPDFNSATASNGGVSSQSMNLPFGVTSDGTRLIVADGTHRRVLIWNSIPTSMQQPADSVVGQPNFTSNNRWNSGATVNTASLPTSVSTDGRILTAVNYDFHRVLIWNPLPTSNNAPPDIVLGQPDMTSSVVNNGGLSAQSLQYPDGVFYDGTRLYVADSYNHRVLIWRRLPTTNQQAADIVLGQPSMSVNAANNGGKSAGSLNFPRFAYSDGTRFFVADGDNNRVLIWNSIPDSSSVPADIVLGQPDMTSNASNNGGVSAQSLYRPYGVVTYGGRLAVTDISNHRVLIWNTIPTINQTPADVVLGQPDMVSSAPNNGGLGAKTLSSPVHVTWDATGIYVGDERNNRLLHWAQTPTTNFMPASEVIGQPNFITNSPNWGGLSETSHYAPTMLLPYANGILIADFLNNRIIVENWRESSRASFEWIHNLKTSFLRLWEQIKVRRRSDH